MVENSPNLVQGCQIFLCATYENGEKAIPLNFKCAKWPQNIPNSHKIDKWTHNIPAPSIARPSKIYPNRDFWFENLATLIWSPCRRHKRRKAPFFSSSGFNATGVLKSAKKQGFHFFPFVFEPGLPDDIFSNQFG
jgi:hypothetical protein